MTSGYADLILSALRRRPERTAFRFTGDDETKHTWTYSETAERIERTAAAFGRLGLMPGNGLALLCGPNPQAFTIMAAACLAGLRYTALHPLATADTDRTVLRDSASDCLVVDDTRFAARARPDGTKAISSPNSTASPQTHPLVRTTRAAPRSTSSTPAARPANPRA